MKFGDENGGTPEPEAPNRADIPEANGGAIMLVLNLLKRDFRLWLLALLRGWPWLIAVPTVCGLAVFCYVTFFVPLRFEATCSLFRYELQSMRRSGIPEEYRPVQLSVILNMLRSRANLTATIERLNLNMSPGQLFGMIRVRQPSRNVNYIYVAVKSARPELSAEIANTLSQVFIEDYKLLIRRNLAEVLVTVDRSRKGLVNEIDTLSAQLHDMSTRYNMLSVDEELSKLGAQILDTETRLQRERANANSLSSEISALQVELSKLPPTIVLHEEENTERQSALEAERVKLQQMRQVLTDANPKVQQQIEIIKVMEADLERSGRSNLKNKIISGQNPLYKNISEALQNKTSELVGIRSRLAEYEQTLEKFREQRVTLNKIRPDFVATSDLIEQKKRMLNSIEDTKKSVEIFLERSYSDIMIYEPAVPLSGALPRKRTMLSLTGFALGLAATLGVLLLLEGLNFRVRSRTDVEGALQLELVGAIPELVPDDRARFYSAMQQCVVNLERKLASASRPALMMVAPLNLEDFSVQLQDDLLELLNVRNIRTVVVHSVLSLEGERVNYLLNDYLYGLSDTPPEPDKQGNFYFMLDDMAFLAPPPRDRILALKGKLECDWLIWDLFCCSEDAQLFVQLCELADLTLIPLKFAVSDKSQLASGLKELRINGVNNLVALLYGVKVKLYSLVS